MANPEQPSQPFLEHVPDDDTGYRLRLVRPLPCSALIDAGERYAEVVTDIYGARSVCHIGLAASGVGFAYSGMWYRDTADGMDDIAVDLDVRSPQLFDTGGRPSVVFDNSLRDGTTLARAAGFLHRRFIYPETFIKLIDYEDNREENIREWAAQTLGMQVLSLYKASQAGHLIVDQS